MDLLWLLAGGSAVFIVVGLPLMLRKVPKNHVYGIRTESALSGTDENWYAINERGGKAVFTAGVLSMLAILILHWLPIRRDIADTSAFVILVGSVISALLYSCRNKR